MSRQTGKKKVALIGGLGALLNIVLNLVLIPRWSYSGAGVATVFTEAFMAVGLWLQMIDELGVLKILFGRFFRWGGNDERGSGFIDQN